MRFSPLSLLWAFVAVINALAIFGPQESVTTQRILHGAIAMMALSLMSFTKRRH